MDKQKEWDRIKVLLRQQGRVDCILNKTLKTETVMITRAPNAMGALALYRYQTTKEWSETLKDAKVHPNTIQTPTT